MAIDYTKQEYLMSDIRWAYTQNGELLVPYIMNNDGNKFRNLLTNRVYNCAASGAPDNSDIEPVAEIMAKVYGVNAEDVHLATFSAMLNAFTEGANIKGAPFKRLRRDIMFNKNGYRGGKIMRHLKSSVVSLDDLIPTYNQLKDTIEARYASRKKGVMQKTNLLRDCDSGRDF